jgi:hypothetical protein
VPFFDRLTLALQIFPPAFDALNRGQGKPLNPGFMHNPFIGLSIVDQGLIAPLGVDVVA